MNTRRNFLKQAVIISVCASSGTRLPAIVFTSKKQKKMKLGLVTYQWGRDWDVPTLITNCEKARLSGVELRVEHAHAITPNLSLEERKTVAKRFADSSVTLVGFGTTCEFHMPDPNALRTHIEEAKKYIMLSKDCGATGIKVRPNDLPREVEKEKTIAQIAHSLNEIGRFAANYGQEIRLEIHGGCAQIPIIKSVIDQVSEKNVGLCWNCNGQDLEGPGLKENFESVKNRLSGVIHIRELASDTYPTRTLFDLLHSVKYDGYLLIEEGAMLTSDERIRRLTKSAEIFAEWQKK